MSTSKPLKDNNKNACFLYCSISCAGCKEKREYKFCKFEPDLPFFQI